MLNSFLKFMDKNYGRIVAGHVAAGAVGAPVAMWRDPQFSHMVRNPNNNVQGKCYTHKERVHNITIFVITGGLCGALLGGTFPLSWMVLSIAQCREQSTN